MKELDKVVRIRRNWSVSTESFPTPAPANCWSYSNSICAAKPIPTQSSVLPTLMRTGPSRIGSVRSAGASGSASASVVVLGSAERAPPESLPDSWLIAPLSLATCRVLFFWLPSSAPRRAEPPGNRGRSRPLRLPSRPLLWQPAPARSRSATARPLAARCPRDLPSASLGEGASLRTFFRAPSPRPPDLSHQHPAPRPARPRRTPAR